MAISRMQEPQQIQSGIGSLQDPRQVDLWEAVVALEIFLNYLVQ